MRVCQQAGRTGQCLPLFPASCPPFSPFFLSLCLGRSAGRRHVTAERFSLTFALHFCFVPDGTPVSRSRSAACLQMVVASPLLLGGASLLSVVLKTLLVTRGGEELVLWQTCRPQSRDMISVHVTFETYAKKCAAHIHAPALYTLAHGYDHRLQRYKP